MSPIIKNEHSNTDQQIKGDRNSHNTEPLKVPKHEIFVTEIYTLSDPSWVGDLGTEAKNPFL